MNYINMAILLLAPGVFVAFLGYVMAGWVGMLLCSGIYVVLTRVVCRRGERILLSKHRAIQLPDEGSLSGRRMGDQSPCMGLLILLSWDELAAVIGKARRF